MNELNTGFIKLLKLFVPIALLIVGCSSGDGTNFENSQVTTLAGTGAMGSGNGTGISASFNSPFAITNDGNNLYVADTGNNLIRQIVIATGAVTTIAGSLAVGSANGVGTAATFNGPYGIATDNTNLYVADTGNNLIRKIVIATGAVTTLAGSGIIGSADGIGALATFNGPYGISTDNTNLYVTDSTNHLIRQIVIATGAVTTLAGSGAIGSADGTGVAASFNSPRGIVTNGANLYLADTLNFNIRQIVIATGVVTTLAGSGTSGSIDHIGTVASFNTPTGISTDGVSLYVGDTFNNKIRKIAIASGEVTTLAGLGLTGSADGAGSEATFQGPTGMTTIGINHYVTDTGNHLIRQIN